jgi:hypothetical protein
MEEMPPCLGFQVLQVAILFNSFACASSLKLHELRGYESHRRDLESNPTQAHAVASMIVVACLVAAVSGLHSQPRLRCDLTQGKQHL